jgi:hypothetical protein
VGGHVVLCVVQATVTAALPDSGGRRLGRIKHNMSLIKALLLLPLEQVHSFVEAVLGWGSPMLSGAVFALLQGIGKSLPDLVPLQKAADPD